VSSAARRIDRPGPRMQATHPARPARLRSPGSRAGGRSQRATRTPLPSPPFLDERSSSTATCAHELRTPRAPAQRRFSAGRLQLGPPPAAGVWGASSRNPCPTNRRALIKITGLRRPGTARDVDAGAARQVADHSIARVPAISLCVYISFGEDGSGFRITISCPPA
jgi:hypothetical protein